MKNKITAIIFDMDGVISDTQKLHAKVDSEILNRFGINISPDEITRKYAGMKTSKVFDDLLKNQSQSYDVEKLMVEKWTSTFRLCKSGIVEVEGAVELIHTLYDKGFKMAVASASNQIYVRNVIKSLNLEKYFEFLVSGDMVMNGKPDPEIFLLAASKLEIAPENCLVIEDGVSGMQAAKSGNMKCIGLVTYKDRDYPTENTVLSLKEVTLQYIENLL